MYLIYILVSLCISDNFNPYCLRSDCEMNIHKSCAKLVEELCIGQVRKKPPKTKKLPSFLGNMIPDDKDNKRKNSQISGGNNPSE